MEPTIGRIVHLKLTEQQKNSINGNKAEVLPAVIVAVWGPTCVNLKVMTDGVNDLWVTSAQQGENEGQWNWPVKA
jgi:hypothetical protein